MDEQTEDVVTEEPEATGPTTVYKVVRLDDDGNLVSAIMPKMHAVVYREGKKIKKVKTAQAFRFIEDAQRLITDWTPYRTLQLWEAEAATVRPLLDALRDDPKPVDDPRIYDCTDLKLVRRLDLDNLFG